MKRIGVVTCIYQNNYGSLLQAYATAAFLNSMGMKSEFIDYRDIKNIKIKKGIFFFSQLFCWNYSKYKIPMLINLINKKLVNNQYTQNIKKRRIKFDEFRKKYFIVSNRCKTLKEMRDMILEKYDSLLVGSDQLWLPANVFAGFYTLDFIERGMINKVSFSTSFGQKQYPKMLKNKYRKFLSDFSSISVREAFGVDLISNISDKKARVFCDPVFLLRKEEWLSLIGEDVKRENRYVFCYFLGNHPDMLLMIKDYCEKNSYEMVVVANDERECSEEKNADSLLYDASPEVFLNYIHHAELIFTDSFHCSAFSIIFGKKFVPIMKYKDSNKYSTNGRIEELLETFGEKYRYMDYKNTEIEKLSYWINEDVDSILNKKREEAKEYLLDALK